MEQHYLQSTYREKLIEHLFVGELLKYSWYHRKCALEIAKPEVDSCGYDLIATEGAVVRHLQLKTSHRSASASSQKVHLALGRKQSGCVVWIKFDADSLELGPYLAFASSPGEKLPALDEFRIAQHTKPNSEGRKAERQNLRVVPKSRFLETRTIASLYSLLFGDE
jgi:hypothetical protein